MADSSTTTSTGTIEFIEHHKPGLEDGDYTIAVTQVVSTRDQTTISRDNTFTAARTFTVAGERFELKPSEIYAVFPPEGSLGEHSNALPHVILNRSTLPWEREAEQNKEDAPWLALLLFDDQEKPQLIQSNASIPGNALRIVTVAELMNPAPGGPRFPALTLERGQDANDKVS